MILKSALQNARYCKTHRRESWRGGVRGSAAPPATEIMSFFRQNAHDLGMDTCEKTMQNNAVGVISKTHK